MTTLAVAGLLWEATASTKNDSKIPTVAGTTFKVQVYTEERLLLQHFVANFSFSNGPRRLGGITSLLNKEQGTNSPSEDGVPGCEDEYSSQTQCQG